MPKMKTKSAAKKRFRVTGTGLVKRKHAYKSHILTKKSVKRKRNLRHATIVEPANMKAVREMLLM
ncbi:MAG: 50S ribosomal protein L35 [Lentimicrobiaceae bacterium]|nr:50S ribosomal protein L35 [Lentimicrobiaceae bacterium]MBQ2906671.1 50S ribosomal protein L35 [Bacteroidales bacterium]MBE6343068.1 50S ribosomal protein L35 [Lentimicrobiaceae bacterium]MBQ3595056.1 50S ribosomal protein L35 [Bacteroidales bacterium]MBQ4548858.1 50S ribosomal protein L35 [Bacteroidales bacterium]